MALSRISRARKQRIGSSSRSGSNSGCKMKVFDTGVEDVYTAEPLERYTVVAPDKKTAIQLTKKEYGLEKFKENKNLDIDVNDYRTKTLDEYNSRRTEKLPDEEHVERLPSF